ncbi:hypothetical protein QQF64_015697 [Cirrhinus molitorella]|uniref:Uncharacterized protein n=1 Tax=Cirrhinus molitorella TaxID=172907 RepID=A0ABR3NWD2_9TELE
MNIKDTQCASSTAAVTPQEERSARSALGEESRSSVATRPPGGAGNTAAVLLQLRCCVYILFITRYRLLLQLQTLAS